MKKITKFLIPVFIFLILVAPAVSFAQTEVWKGLVPCGTKENPTTCDFTAFMKLIDTLIKFILFKLAVPIAAIMFFYAGFLMVTSGGSTESRGRAKTIFTNTALGLVFVAGAWLIIKTLLSILGYDGAWIGFPL